MHTNMLTISKLFFAVLIGRLVLEKFDLQTFATLNSESAEDNRKDKFKKWLDIVFKMEREERAKRIARATHAHQGEQGDNGGVKSESNVKEERKDDATSSSNNVSDTKKRKRSADSHESDETKVKVRKEHEQSSKKKKKRKKSKGTEVSVPQESELVSGTSSSDTDSSKRKKKRSKKDVTDAAGTLQYLGVAIFNLLLSFFELAIMIDRSEAIAL